MEITIEVTKKTYTNEDPNYQKPCKPPALAVGI